MLVTISRDDAARLVIEAVRHAVCCSGAVVEEVCDAAEQMLRALTIAEADEVAAVISPEASDRIGCVSTQADRDHWQRLRRQLLDRTLTGAPARVPIISRDLALLCVCVERRAASLDAATRAEALALVERTRRSLPPEEQTLFPWIELGEPVVAGPAGRAAPEVEDT